MLCERCCQSGFFGQKTFSSLSVLLMHFLVVLAQGHLTVMTMSWPVWQALDMACEPMHFWSPSGSLGHCWYGLCSETSWARGLELWLTSSPGSVMVCLTYRVLWWLELPSTSRPTLGPDLKRMWRIKLCSWDTSTYKGQDMFVTKACHWFFCELCNAAVVICPLQICMPRPKTKQGELLMLVWKRVCFEESCQPTQRASSPKKTLCMLRQRHH